MKKTMCILATTVTMFTGSFFLTNLTSAGDLEPASPPSSTMNTLEEIYNRPVWPMKDNVFVDWVDNPRFAVSEGEYPLSPNDDLVLDKETGLIWARNADIATYLPHNYKIYETTSVEGPFTLPEASEYCRRLKLSKHMGWRLPTIEELSSLVDTTTPSGLPAGHPFLNVQTDYPYWSCTPSFFSPVPAGSFWFILFNSKFTSYYGLLNKGYVLPVRGGSERLPNDKNVNQ